MNEPPEVFTPEQAARALGISPSGLRRLASIYERVRHELPRESAKRVWHHEALAELKRARELVATHKAPSIEAALQASEDIIDSSAAVEGINSFNNELRDNEALFSLLRELREEVHSLRREVAELRALPVSEPKKQDRSEEPPSGNLWTRFLYYWRHPN